MDSENIESIAADWLAKRDSGTWTDADEAAFREWQNAATAHRVTVIRLKTVWQQADRLQALGAGVERGTIPPPGQWRIAPVLEPKRSPALLDAYAATGAEEAPAP